MRAEDFRRVDVQPPVELLANAMGVGDTRMASVLEKDGVRVSTVEHLLSACAGLGIDNLVFLAILADRSSSPSRARLKAALLEKYPKAKWYTYEPVDIPSAPASIASRSRLRTRSRNDRALPT